MTKGDVDAYIASQLSALQASGEKEAGDLPGSMPPKKTKNEYGNRDIDYSKVNLLEVPAPEADPNKKGVKYTDGPHKGKWMTDMGGRPIDYDPPKQGELPARRIKGTSRIIYWCGECGRWGNHTTAGHAKFGEWLALRKLQREQEAATGGAAANVASSTVNEHGDEVEMNLPSGI